jgi:lipopolysaccharide assembly outer membrane protein LptD (OstA)
MCWPRIVYDARTKIATATGKVVITYGKYQLVATRVTYDSEKDKLTANGAVRLKEPGGNIWKPMKRSSMIASGKALPATSCPAHQ